LKNGVFVISITREILGNTGKFSSSSSLSEVSLYSNAISCRCPSTTDTLSETDWGNS